MKTKWKLRNSEGNREQAKELAKSLKINPILSQILLNRGISTEEQAREFLWPKLSQLYDPSLIPDMDKAVKRIIRAVENGEHITVYADYDADGTIAAAILILYLESLGAQVDYYIPNRLLEGYGMNNDALDEIKKRGTDLIITVDNGIAAPEQAKHIEELGMDLVITDHHEPQDVLPKAEAILDCKRLDSEYPFKELCGAGVAFKLVCALEEELGTGADLLEFLQMATVSTVADVVPLTGENRIIVKNGIESINSEGFIHEGLNKLKEVSGIDELDTYTIGFRIGPMINAPGRLGEADEVMRLLLSDDPDEIEEQARLLYEKNVERTRIEKRILDEAMKAVEENKLYEDDVIVVSGEGWHSGIIGIVASKIQEKWNRPVIIISFDENGLGRGSCRSIPGFNIFEALKSCAPLFESFGGHEQAAGLSIKRENLEELKKALKAYTGKIDTKDLFIRQYLYDFETDADGFNLETVRALKDFEPTGIGNPAPVFKIRAGTATDFRLMGADKSHLGFQADGVKCVGFGLGNEYAHGIKAPVHFLAKAELNCYNNFENTQFKIKDIKENPFISLEAAQKVLSDCEDAAELVEELKEYGKPVSVERKLLVMVYNLIKNSGNSGFLVEQFLEKTGESVFALAAALIILKEASLIEYELSPAVIKGRLIPPQGKMDLTKMPTFQLLQAARLEAEKEQTR